MEFGEKIVQAKRQTKLRFILLWKKSSTGAHLQNPEDGMFVVDSEASMHMLSKKDLSSDEMDSLRRSKKPTTVVTAN